MSAPLQDQEKPCEPTFIEGFGYLLRLSEGEEDTTIRPSGRARRRDKAQEPPLSRSETRGGPDLDDWLNRTFDD